jgi:hypothetical protein
VFLAVVLGSVSFTCVMQATRAVIDPPLSLGVVLCDVIAGGIWTGVVLYLRQVWALKDGTLVEPVLDDSVEIRVVMDPSESLPIASLAAQSVESAAPLAGTATQLVGTATQLVETAAQLVENATSPTPPVTPAS